MLKKRLIFILLYCDGYFMLSRNFRLQRVGDLNWLISNYDFSHISFFIDELIILDVSRKEKQTKNFIDTLKTISYKCFVPIASGGGVHSISDAKILLRSGADKVIINSSLFEENDFLVNLSEEFGDQSIVASVDVKKSSEHGYQAVKKSGSEIVNKSLTEILNNLMQSPIGELYLNSIDNDGTGDGYDFNLINLLPKNCHKPLIIAGGADNSKRLLEGFKNSSIDAVATAHLFNFIGDGLKSARNKLIESGVPLPIWDLDTVYDYKDILNAND
jgi:cyclase